MTVKSFKYLGPKQQQVLRELAEGWELWDMHPPRLMAYGTNKGKGCETYQWVPGYVSKCMVTRCLIRGLVSRGLIRHDNLDPNYPHRFGWVLTVRGKLEVEKMKRR